MEPPTKENSNSLLLLGLELLKNLNKSAKLPYAVVKPRIQVQSAESGEPEQDSDVKQLEHPMSGNDRKRKHSNGETVEVHKKEKR